MHLDCYLADSTGHVGHATLSRGAQMRKTRREDNNHDQAYRYILLTYIFQDETAARSLYDNNHNHRHFHTVLVLTTRLLTSLLDMELILREFEVNKTKIISNYDQYDSIMNLKSFLVISHILLKSNEQVLTGTYAQLEVFDDLWSCGKMDMHNLDGRGELVFCTVQFYNMIKHELGLQIVNFKTAKSFSA